MKNSIRIRTSPNGGDNFVRIKLDQSFDFLEILSLKLRQDELYRIFAADYGVIVGRVIANRGFGVPNAKVSVFVPLDVNEGDPEIIGRYLFNAVSDTDINGVRYNLLEDTKQGKCHSPVGTFPNKRKVLDNDVWLEIYDTYYKYTTTTNQAGDFMIFGVPIGNQQLHMDVDVSDIGFVSVKPYELMNQGYTDKLFDSNTTFKSGTDLDTLVQIQSRDFNVNVLPFWGDSEENEIGINRVDFNLNVDITPTAQFFGSIFTEQRNVGVYKGCTPRILNGRNCYLNTGVGQVEYIRRISNNSNDVEFISNKTTKIDENGNWAIILPMNINPVVTDEFGNLIPSEDPTIGIPTETMCRFRVYLDEHRFGFRKRTGNYLVPNMYNRFQFGTDTQDDDFFTLRWKKAYTVTNYIPRYQKFDVLQDGTNYFTGIKLIGNCEDTTSFPFNRIDANVNPIYDILCIILTIVGFLLDIINEILRDIIFGVVLKFTCFLKHPFNSAQRSACRCQACFNLNDEEVPLNWTGSAPDDSNNGGQGSDSTLCSACYDGEGTNTFALVTSYDLTTDITVNSIDATNGVYTLSPSATSGTGDDATFQVTVAGNTVTQVIVVTGGRGWKAGDTITFSTAQIGGTTNVVVTIPSAALTTIITIDGTDYDCSIFDYDDCIDLCQECEATLFELQCDEDNIYNSGEDWADCVAQNLAESMGVIGYEFYNDWVIGSLYSYLFDYKIKLKKKGKNYEKFCDYDCRQVAGTPVGDEHYKNKCRRAQIIDKLAFNDGTALRTEVNGTTGRGLVVEYNDFLYYASRHDVEINLSGTTGLTVPEKKNLLFATNLIELGSVVTCDIDGEPFVIDRLEPTTHKDDDGVKTLFDVTNCGLPLINNYNFNGIQLVSQAGVDILVSETERTGSVIDGDDDESYTIIGDETNFPDYDGNPTHSIIILDRDDVILRRTLCENFNYYGISGSYSTTAHPSLPLTDYLTDDDGDPVESTTDICAGFDDVRDDVTYFPADNMPPYYMYFGIRLGNTSLDKLKDLYYDNCIE